MTNIDKLLGVTIMDQAESLRRITTPKQQSARMLAISSGKGGVGKTNIVTNLALALSDLDQRVLIFDADIGLANVDILLGIIPKYTLENVLKQEKEFTDILIKYQRGVQILPAASGVQELTTLNEEQQLIILGELEELFNNFDIILLDTAAGIGSNVTYFCTSANEIIVIASPEPTSITDAYALMKVLYNGYAQKDFKLIINSAKHEKEAKEIYKQLSVVSDRFLPNITIDFIGFILLDENVPRSVKQQQPFYEQYPTSKASLCIKLIAKKLMETPQTTKQQSTSMSLRNLFLNNSVVI